MLDYIEINRLRERVDEVDRRIAELERKNDHWRTVERCERQEGRS